MSDSPNKFDDDFPNKNVQSIRVRYAYDAQIGYVIRGTLVDCFDINVVPSELVYDVRQGLELGDLDLDAKELAVTCSAKLLNGDWAFLGFTLHEPQRIAFDERGCRIFEEPAPRDMELECRLAGTDTELYYDFEGEAWFDNENNEYEVVSGGLKCCG